MRRGPLAVLLCLPLHAGLATDAAAQTTPTPNSDGSYTVPWNWSLIPSGLDSGDSFRLLFVSTQEDNAVSSDIARYNGLIQGFAEGSLVLRPWASAFRVLGSTPAVDARDNTSTTGTGVPIYWVAGLKVADTYTDFYDGTWDSVASRTQIGSVNRKNWIWTGSQANGTGFPGQEFGGASVRQGALDSASVTLSNRESTSPAALRPFYGLSPVFKVGEEPEVTITSGSAVTEGGQASFTISVDPAPEEALTVNLSVADAASSDFVAAGDEGADTVMLAAGSTTATFTVATVNDTGGTGDEPDGEVTVTLLAGAGYTVGTASSASVAVSDNDATTVTLEGVAVNLPEGSSLEFSVRLNRELVAGETLPVPVTFGGDASLAQFSVSCPSTSMLPQGVTCANLGTATATVTFTGPSAKLVDLEVTATVDSDAESAESLAIGLGTLNANSGTGLGGGATGVDNLADFNIVDAIGVALAFTREASSVNEGTMNAVAQFTANVVSGTVPAGGVVIPFTVNTGTAQAGDASTADYGTVPAGITIAAGALSGTADLPIVDDLEDELTERIRFVVGELPPGYRFADGFDTLPREVSIVDDDETEISLTGGGTITEQDTTTTATLTVSASRRLLSDPRKVPPLETLTVPLVLATTTGAALPGSASPLFAVTASGTGVTLGGANSATPTLTFTGHNTDTVRTATVTITATANGDADSTAETVTATLGNMTAQMDGGVIATMANSATLTVADDDAPPQLSVSLVGTDLRQVSVSEGETATIRVRRDGGDASAALTFSATATAAAGFGDTFTAVTSIPAGQRSVDIVYSVAEDTADAPRGEATYVLSTGSGYTVSSTAGSVSLVVVDNDPTEVTLAAASGNMQEGDQRNLIISSTRALVSGEVLVVPLTFAGKATRGTDYTLSGLTTTNVTYQNLNTGSATVTFTGSASRTAVIQLTAVADDMVEATAETVDIGLGPLNENSGTGLDGGASTNDTLDVFSIEDLAANTVSLSVSDDGEATEGDDALTITATLDRANDSGSAISIPIEIHPDETTAQAADYVMASSISIADAARSGTTSFTVTDDQIAEGTETVVIELGSTLPTDVVAGAHAVAIDITDNDTPGLVFSPTSLGVAEGDDESYTVRLATEPTSTVTVTITGHSGTDLTLDATSLQFTTSTWEDEQTVTVTAAEDDDTADDTATLAHAASGGGYDAVEADLAVTVTDNDSAGLVLSPTSLEVDEGDDASYTVRLATEPTGTVTVTITVPAGTDLTLDATSLQFTTSTWEDEQTVTVTAAEDDDTADDTATLAHAAAGGGYSLSANLAVTVTDDDTAGLVFSPTSLDVDEGDDASYTVKLATEPTGTVTVTVSGHSGTDLTLDATSLEFTTSTWEDEQTVTVTAGEDDDTADDAATLAHAAAGGGYGGVEADLAVTVTDDDTPGLVFSPTALAVNEDADASYTVKLATEPTGTVTVTITGHSGTDLTLTVTSLEFTTSTWDDAQTVTVTAGDDPDTANDAATLTHAAAGGGYSVSSDLAVTVTDNDAPNLILSPTSLKVDEGADARYTVRLATLPTGTVTVAISGQSGTDLTLDATSLEFTTSTWDDAQTVTVTAGEDPDLTDDTATLTHAASGGGYSVSADLAVTVTDDDLPVVSFTSSSSSAGEGSGTLDVTVSLSPAPTAAITVGYTVGGTATAGSDFSISGSGTLSVASGATTATVPVAITDDAEEESGETVVLTLTAGSGYTLGSTNSHTLTITDNDGTTSPPPPPPPPPNDPPTVSLSCDPCEINRGGEVALAATASDPDGDGLTYAWSAPTGAFAGPTDGAAARWTAPDETGPVTIRVEVSDGQGGTASAGVTVEVVNRPPASVTVSCDPCEVPRGGEAALTATASDPDGDELTYAWSAPTGAFAGPTDGATARWTAPDEIGPVTIRVEVSDGHGGTASAEVTVEVVNRPPTVTVSCDPCEVPRGGEVALTATATDPDGDELTYDWSAPAGRFIEATDAATARWTAPEEVGSVTIRVDVSDGYGGTASAEVTVEVVNRPPASVTVSCDPCEVPRGGEAALTATATDPDGDELTYAWSAPTGAFAGPTDGATTRWTAPDEIGPVTIRVEVSDGHGGTASAEVTVEVANRPPASVTVSCDPCEVPRGGEVALTATASDPDGDSLTYDWSAPAGRFIEATDAATTRWTAPDEVGPVTIRVEVSDGRGGTASAEVTVDVANRSPTVTASCDPCEIHRGGEVALTAMASDPDGDDLAYAWSAAAGSFSEAADAATARWTAPGTTGVVTIEVEVSDGHGGTASAEVTVEVANRPPVFESSEYALELRENVDGSRRPVDLGAVTASDPDGDELTYDLTSGDGSRFKAAGRDGMVRYAGPGEDFESEPNRYELALRARDPYGAEAEARVVVTVVNVNEAPAAADDEATTDEDRALTVDVLANDTDPDGDGLRVESVSAPAHGTTRVASDGGVTYTPAANYHGVDRFTYVVSDPDGLTAEAAVEVTVLSVNDPPEAEDDEATTDEDRALTVDVLANDTDPDGDGLWVESVSAAAHGTTRIASDGGVTYTPAANYHGVDRFTYVVSDPDGLTAEAAVSVTVLSVNDAPIAVGVIPDQPLDEGGVSVDLDLTPFFDDADGDPLTYRAVSSDTDVATVGVAGAVLTLTPVAYGSAMVRVTAEDPDGLTGSQTFTVGVDDRLVRAVMSDTLAAMARSHLASARMTLGRRVEAGAAGESRLTVMGRSVPLGGASARRAAEQLVAGWLSSIAWSGASAQGPGGLFGPAGMSPGFGAYPGGGLGGPGGGLGGPGGGLGGPGGGFGGPGGGLGGPGGGFGGPGGGLGGPGGGFGGPGGGFGGPGGGFGGPGGGLGGPGGGFGGPGGGLGGPGGGFGGPGGGLGGPGGGFGGPALGGPAALGMPPVSSGALLYGLGGFGGGSETLLRGTEFELALGGGEDGRARAGRRWSVWGQGDIQTFRGAPTLLGYDARYDGDVRTGYVGVDAQLTRRWLAGVAVSRSGGRGDWEVGSARGRLRTTLTALHPYAQWSNGTTSVWTTAGGGWGGGEAETVREATGRVGASGLGLRLGLVELRRRVGAVGGGAELGLRADAAWAELRTGEGRESVDRLTAAVNQQRVGAEVSRPVRVGALALAPFGEAHLRRDEGGGQNGLGMEVAFGVGLTSGIVRLDVQGRTLAMHSAAGYGERGAGLTLTVGGRRREGLSLSVSPSWGDAASGTGTLWQEEVYRQYLSVKEQDAFAVDARGEYGMRLPSGGLLNWFGSYSHSPYGRSFLVGGSIGGLADALLPGR